jgi:hypothetical protein
VRTRVAFVVVTAMAVTFVALACRPASASTSAAPLAPVTSEERYGPDPAQVVTVVRPAGAYLNRKTVVFVHGGAWTGGTRTTWTAEALEWAERGWVTINMDYRPAVLDGVPGDGLREGRDVRAVYTKYAALPFTGRFVLVGDSAGGHLATAVGAQLGRASVAGVIAWSPVATPRDMAARTNLPGRSARQRVLGRKSKEFWGFDFDAWSAHRYIRAGTAPAMFVVGGARETYVVWSEQGGTLCRTPGFLGECTILPTDLHATHLWTTSAGAIQRDRARVWADARVTAGPGSDPGGR